jgi:outer membrane protein insertion porin family
MPHRLFSSSLRLLAITALWLACAVPAMAAGDGPGPRIQGIAIAGLVRTQPRTVLRELPFAKGDLWQDRDAGESERRLRNLDIFSEAHVSPPDANGIVHIRLKERWALWLLPEVSRHDNGDTSAGATFTDYNLWGLRHQVRLAYRKDTGKNFGGGVTGSSYSANYQWYRIADSLWSMDMYGTRGQQIFDAYQGGVVQSEYLNHVDSTGFNVHRGFGPVPTQGTTLSLGYDSTTSSYTLLGGPAQADVLGQRRHSLNMGLDYQWINNHITWLNGERMGYHVSAADKAFGSSVQVYRQTAYYYLYYPYSDQKTLNLRLNGGVATGDVLRDGLFDIGGSKGVRGYIGGELQGSAYLEGSIESRIPIQHDSNVQWVAFTDLGYLARKAEVSASKPFAVGTGTGIRWTLRWLVHGIVRADAAYGWATHKWRFYLGTGQAF